jgi:hypothetical protein
MNSSFQWVICAHGDRTARIGKSQQGKPWAALFCPADNCPPIWGSRELVGEIAGLHDQIRRLQTDRPVRAPAGAIYSDRVAKLLNLAVGATTNGEAALAFVRAWQIHQQERKTS